MRSCMRIGWVARLLWRAPVLERLFVFLRETTMKLHRRFFFLKKKIENEKTTRNIHLYYLGGFAIFGVGIETVTAQMLQEV